MVNGSLLFTLQKKNSIVHGHQGQLLEECSNGSYKMATKIFGRIKEKIQG